MGNGCNALQGANFISVPEFNWRNPGYSQNDRHPVVCVNVDDAFSYTSWLSRKTGKSCRILSEAEREYVTRAGTITPFWWGSSISPVQANNNYSFTYGGNEKSTPLMRTVPVDAFGANAWGLFNVHGNVQEWTEDCWNGTLSGIPTDGSARKIGYCDKHVVRGGSFIQPPNRVRSATRHTMTSDARVNYYGFRVARTLLSKPH